MNTTGANDGIFNNSYNTLEFECPTNESELKLANFSYIQPNLIDIDYLQLDFLKSDVLGVFNKSPFRNKTKRELNHKEVIIELFLYFYEKYEFEINHNKITNIDFVLALAETLNLDYDILYQNVPEQFKEILKKELNIKERKTKKLFRENV